MYCTGVHVRYSGGKDPGATPVPGARVGRGSVGGRVTPVTQTPDATVIAEALTVIDRSLAELAARELVSAAEMSDLLLDLRLLLMAGDPQVGDLGVAEGAPV